MRGLLIPNNSNEFILWLFNRRCIGLHEPCHKYTTEIHEIVPRSAGMDSMDWRNRVTLCHFHHMQFHQEGASDELIQLLQECRKEYLEMIGRGQYV